MRHVFCSRVNAGIPAVGDLIRSENSMGFVNIVLEVIKSENKTFIRSVRYGASNGGDFKLLNGQRSRVFEWYYRWSIVDEYVKLDNIEARKAIVKSCVGLDTGYKTPE